MRVAIHQPNFVPWYPYFQKIESVDTFIFLTQCQFERKTGYQYRFHIGEKWYTLRTKKMPLGTNISEIEYLDPIIDSQKIITPNPRYEHIHSMILDLVENYGNNLSKINIGIIESIINRFGIGTKLMIDSDIDIDSSLKSTDRLIALIKEVGGTEYLSGLGAKDYLDESLFIKNGIKLIWQEESQLIKKPILEVLYEFTKNKRN